MQPTVPGTISVPCWYPPLDIPFWYPAWVGRIWEKFFHSKDPTHFAKLVGDMVENGGRVPRAAGSYSQSFSDRKVIGNTGPIICLP